MRGLEFHFFFAKQKIEKEINFKCEFTIFTYGIAAVSQSFRLGIYQRLGYKQIMFSPYVDSVEIMNKLTPDA